MSKIMVVDDEIEIAEMIEDFLRIEDIEVVKANSAEKALELFTDDIELLVLDINLDGMNGIELCKHIRKTNYVPIIFLTCKNSQNDMLLGFGVGADDYITKPFNPVELVARIKANIRRIRSYNKGSIKDEIITFGDIAIYRKGYKVYKNKEDVNITSKEFNLLLYLIENAYIVLSRNQILNNVWGDSFYDENLVNTTIKRLRKKIEDDPDNPVYIKTIWGAGYVFEGDVR
ncbi:MAG TPA: response regulator transcription factor [Bacillota bacterium]|jgi:DNA-binding response OmpR family regulator|nr:response regulator transcription factor [Bacillota bacterium]HRS20446.1 response regulator transcription factor [Clostridia bacterium]HRU41117.1 response regulator transcription factor [Candidatus Diapherotrites archaeon]HQI15729.1 response regulator transcription factor [Bacillota bacterium]HQJ36611.1 response regulator transcription factor [Bacillota bacterium]